MKKSIKLWITISNMFYEVICFIFAVIVLISIQILIVPVVKEEIINIQVISRECVKNLVLFFMYVLFVIALVRWINYTMLDNLELEYILMLSKKEYYYYILIKKNSWYYMYMIILSTISGVFEYQKGLSYFINTLIYLLITYSIFNVIYQKGNGWKQSFYKESKRRYKNNEKNKCNSYLGLIILGIKNRYKFISTLIIKILVITVSIIAGNININIKSNILLIIYCCLSLILILTNDIYWKDEKEKIHLFSAIGISCRKYIGINLVSGILWNLIVLCSLLYIFSKDVGICIIFLCVGAFQQLYWNSVYLYTNLKLEKGREVLEIVLYTLFLIIGAVPIVNVLTVIFLLIKIKTNWQR